jgi:DNA (cytosine-5)-methyltransferase 1
MWCEMVNSPLPVENEKNEDRWMSGDGLVSLEVCAGAGGQALGFEKAGFSHSGLVEIDKYSCDTLRENRPTWNVYEQDMRAFIEGAASDFPYLDLLSGGLPCPPFSIAGGQLGERDERNLFPDMLDLTDLLRPRAVMIENVRGFLGGVFDDYRHQLKRQLQSMGYHPEWKLLNASSFGVPQLRPRVVIVAMRKDISEHFVWPEETGPKETTVGGTLYDLMAEQGWEGAKRWREGADDIAPTLVGGSKKHGGPDLGPTRARRAWMSLGVDGAGVANEAPARDFVGTPRLTPRMIARIQGFPDDWAFSGGKTAQCRQIGNAFPPPVAEAVGRAIHAALAKSRAVQVVA